MTTWLAVVVDEICVAATVVAELTKLLWGSKSLCFDTQQFQYICSNKRTFVVDTEMVTLSAPPKLSGADTVLNDCAGSFDHRCLAQISPVHVANYWVDDYVPGPVESVPDE